jgi:transcriptional regulator with XRE-family HTH domain
MRMAKGSKPRHFLRQWRKFRGYTLEVAAERIGMSHQNLGKIERGKVPYNETLLDILADIYRTDRGSLIMRDPTVKDSFWSIYDQLAPVERERLVERVEEEFKKTGTSG